MQNAKHCRVFSYENEKEFGICEIYLDTETKSFVLNPYSQIKIDYSERLFNKTKNYFEEVLSSMDLPHYEHYEGKTFEEVLKIEKSCLLIILRAIDFLEKKSWVLFRHNFFETKYCPSKDLNLPKKNNVIEIPKFDYQSLVLFCDSLDNKINGTGQNF